MDEAAYAQHLKNLGYRDRLFKAQDAFVMDRSKFVAAQCSRRAGKSNGLALRFFDTLDKHPGCFCPYVALTRESARNIMWPVLQEQAEHFKIQLSFTESNLTVTHPNGARLQLFGADMKNFIRRLKGIKTPGAAIDEAQDFGDHLESLVDDVLSPALTDYADSWLAITGTPGPIPRGYFYEITELKKYGFSLHKWTLFENPYLPNAEKFVQDLKSRRGWPDDHPTLRREWGNQWVLDVESLLVRYTAGINDYRDLPVFKRSWTYIMGIDVGFRDADAIAVVAWCPETRTNYLVEETIRTKQGLSELVTETNRLRGVYDISKIVMDEGGLGKKLAEEMRRRYHIPVHAAEKQRKMETVALLNDELRRGTFMAKSNSQFASDSYRVQIDWERSTPDRLVVKHGFHSDIIDAVLYAFKESPAFTFQKPTAKPKYGSEDWAKEEVTEMERQAEEYFQAQEELEKATDYV